MQLSSSSKEQSVHQTYNSSSQFIRSVYMWMWREDKDQWLKKFERITSVDKDRFYQTQHNNKKCECWCKSNSSYYCFAKIVHNILSI